MSVGLAVFGAGSAIAMQCGTASSLIATRALMGVGAALVMPATLSILTNVFTDAKERAKAIGLWAMVGGVGVALGPVVGGWLLEHFAWSSIFAINIPVVVVALVAGRFLVPTSRDPESPRLDIAGALLSIAGHDVAFRCQHCEGVPGRWSAVFKPAAAPRGEGYC